MFPIENDAVILGLLCACLGLVFYTSKLENKFFTLLYKITPTLLLCYLLPALLVSFDIIKEEGSKVYHVTSQYLLPAALILMTLNIDLKAIIGLGSKALIMFLTGTLGIILGGPMALFLVSFIDPDLLGGAGPDAIWRGLSTIAGSWIGGGANQAAMLEVFEYNPNKYGGMVLVDIVMANLWLAALLLGVGKSQQIDSWLQADNTAIEKLKREVAAYTQKISRISSLNDFLYLTALAFTGVGVAHFLGELFSEYLVTNFRVIANAESIFSSLGSSFLWMVVFATVFGIVLSFTPAKNFEGAGASKIGGLFIYLLVASIGMKMDLGRVLENPELLLIGFIWIIIHALLLIAVAKWIKAPYFFLAVGSQANVGGAASAPVIAAEFHPSLSSVGILLAVLGYVIGTAGAYLCALLMEVVSNGVV